MRAWMRVLRAAAWRLRWLYALALVATVLQVAVGWAPIGRAFAAGGAATWRGVSPLVIGGWALLLAVAASLLLAAWPVTRAVGSRLVVVVGAYRGLRAALMGLGILAALIVVVVILPPLFVPSLDDPTSQTTAENAVRTTLLQGLGGAVLLLGAWFTWRQLQTAREGQITERFTRAIDQLGKTQPEVTIGGIYALERIARDSPGDQTAIAEVLTAYVRQHARWPPGTEQPSDRSSSGELLRLRERRPPIQAALTVLARMPRPTGADFRLRLDLRRTDLRRVDLRNARFAWARLEEAHLDGAWMLDAHLERTWLSGASLQGAQPWSAYLEKADLHKANLQDARLYGTHLQGARLTQANLKGARLHGAVLTGADLTGANLQGATADDATEWPDGFDWQAAGVRHDLGVPWMMRIQQSRGFSK